MKKANLDVSNDFDRPPPNRKVSIDVDEIHYWSYRVDYNREYDPEKFKIFAKQNTRALLKAARQFNIDLANPIETAVLLRILALLLFGPERKKGRPLNSKKWNRLRLTQLAIDCEKIKKDRPRLSDAKAAVVIKRRYPERYEDTSSEMMRQRLPQARGEIEKHRFEMGVDAEGRVSFPDQDFDEL